MALDKKFLLELESVALSVIRELAVTGLEFFRSDMKAERKRDRSLVSEADRTIEWKARTLLKMSTPDYGFVGEEFGKLSRLHLHDEDSDGSRSKAEEKNTLNLNEDIHWILDPIDGTTNFLSRSPLWTTLLALIYKGEPVLGIVAIPTTNEVFVASRGNGARYGLLNDLQGVTFRPCAPRPEIPLNEAHLPTTNTSIFMSRGVESWFVKLLARDGEFRTHSDAYGFTRVLCGGIDAMVDATVAPYDVAALQILCDETPGVCYTTLHGHTGKSRYQMGSIVVASSAKLAREILKDYRSHLISTWEAEVSRLTSSSVPVTSDEDFSTLLNLARHNTPYAPHQLESQLWLRGMETGIALFLEENDGYFIEDVSIILGEHRTMEALIRNGEAASPPERNTSTAIHIRAVVAGGTGLVTRTWPASEHPARLVQECLNLALAQSREQKLSPDTEVLAYRDHLVGTHFGAFPWGTAVPAKGFLALTNAVKEFHGTKKLENITSLHTHVEVEVENRLQLFLDASQQSITRGATRVSTTATAERNEGKRKASLRMYLNTLPLGEFDMAPVEADLFTVQSQALEMLDADYVPEQIEYDYLAIDADLLGLILHEAIGHAAEGDLVQLGMSGFGKEGVLQNLKVAPDWVNIVIDGAMDNCGQTIVDAEGTLSTRKCIVRNGTLVDGIHTRQTARTAGSFPDGCARMETLFHPSLNRMTSIWVEATQALPLEPVNPGESLVRPSPETLHAALAREGYLKGNKRVLFLSGWKGGSASCSNLEFRADVARVYLLRENEKPLLMREANFTGIATDCFLSAVAAFGPTLCRSVGVCGKDGQNVYTSDGGPAVFVMEKNPRVQVIGAGDEDEEE